MFHRLRRFLARTPFISPPPAAEPETGPRFSTSPPGDAQHAAPTAPQKASKPNESFNEIRLEISPEELASYSFGNVFMLDVRESFEVAGGIIANAHHIPLGQLPARESEIPRDKKVVVYCAHGIRSLQGAEFLRSQGIEEVKSLSGGLAAWNHMGGEIVPFTKDD